MDFDNIISLSLCLHSVVFLCVVVICCDCVRSCCCLLTATIENIVSYIGVCVRCCYFILYVHVLVQNGCKICFTLLRCIVYALCVCIYGLIGLSFLSEFRCNIKITKIHLIWCKRTQRCSCCSLLTAFLCNFSENLKT